MSKKHHPNDQASGPKQETPSPAPDQPANQAPPEQKPDEAAEWKNKYLYAIAELDNFRKRTLKERKDLLAYAGQEILYDLLEVVDNFNRALEADRKESDPAVIVQGIELIHKQIQKVLEKFGVKPIEAMGAVFDPKVHEALQRIPTADAEPGTVMHELQRGYTVRDRVLRPSRVVVASALPKEEEPSADDAK